MQHVFHCLVRGGIWRHILSGLKSTGAFNISCRDWAETEIRNRTALYNLVTMAIKPAAGVILVHIYHVNTKNNLLM